LRELADCPAAVTDALVEAVEEAEPEKPLAITDEGVSA